MSNPPTLTALAAMLLLGSSIGYWAGNSYPLRTPDAKQSTARATTGTVATEHQQKQPDSNTNARTTTQAQAQTDQDVAWEDSPQTSKADTLRDQIRHLQGLAGSAQPESLIAAGELQQQLSSLARQDSEALQALISAFTENLADPVVSDPLFAILAQIQDPEVEQLAVTLSRSTERNEQIAGLDLLGSLNLPNQETLELTRQIMAGHPDDPQLLLSAIHAAQPMPLAENDSDNMLSSLGELTAHQDAAVRSASLLSIAQWAKDTNQLTPLLQALTSPTQDDRISAAMGLEQSQVTGPSMKPALLARMLDNEELWEVRSMTANALQRHNLSQGEFMQLQNFRQQQIGATPN